MAKKISAKKLKLITAQLNDVLANNGLKDINLVHLGITVNEQTNKLFNCHCDPKTEKMVLDPVTGHCKCVPKDDD